MRVNNKQKNLIENEEICITPFVPEIYAKIKVEEAQTERFPCATCGKSYLRRRHLQRHTRGELKMVKKKQFSP